MSLALYQATDFVAIGLTSASDTIPVAVTWSATGGSIAANGRFSAGADPGEFMVIASVAADGKADTATVVVTAAVTPVASVDVLPADASATVGDTKQFEGVPRDASGTALGGRTVTWSSSNTAVASIDGSGLATAWAAGATTITATSEGKSASATFTVTSLVPQLSTCLVQLGPIVRLDGLRTSAYETYSLAASTKVDASGVQFLLDQAINFPVRVGGGDGICWSGGEVLGQFPPSTSWSTMHDKYGMLPGSNASAHRVRIDNVTVFNYGDGISFDELAIDDWSIRHTHIKYGRDDCIENDFLNGGTIDSTFLDGCYTTVSSRPYSGTPDGTNEVITISNSLLRLQSMDRAYGGTVPNHNAFWKWHSSAPKLALYNNVFRADGPSREGNGSGEYMAPPPGKLADCRDNVMVWLGSGSYPEALPATFNGKPCFTIMTGTAGLDYWNNAVNKWHAAHPNPQPDVAPPVVSLFSPGVSGSTTLTGTVRLTATAVDDRFVTSVQFRLNGQNIGAPVTQDGASGYGLTGPTKYWISWDSRAVANGTYTLTAVARDAAGHVKTSSGVAVTVSN